MSAKKSKKVSPVEKKVIPVKETSKVESKEELPVVKMITDSVIKEVVKTLKPDIELAVNSRFEDIKKIVTSEVQDIRTTIENKLPTPQLEQPQINDKVAHAPENQVRGLENNVMRNPPKQQGANPMEAILPMLMQVLPSLLGKGEQSTQQQNMPNMLVELMMKKFVNDMGRSDTQNQAVTDYLLKQMLKRDPSLLKGFNDLDVTKSSTPNEANQDHF
jgi:hypothetical protein